MSIIDKIDSSPLFRMLTDVIMEGPAMVGRAIGNAVGALTGAGEAGKEASGGFFAGMKEALGFGDNAPAALVQDNTPSMAIQTPAPSMDRFTVGMDELGTFAPPMVGNAARSADMGMSA